MRQGFDCIVIDPPWENKSVKRANEYPTVLSRQLLGIPIPQLLRPVHGSSLQTHRSVLAIALQITLPGVDD